MLHDYYGASLAAQFTTTRFQDGCYKELVSKQLEYEQGGKNEKTKETNITSYTSLKCESNDWMDDILWV